ncbi:YetF domain-containing protein [Paenibacillus silvisoli]|uniref:YetF domain-containing protein n=1 Tax=Paenibacillus silvisoli TaxID=3110539 RepID=UPI00389944C6
MGSDLYFRYSLSCLREILIEEIDELHLRGKIVYKNLKELDLTEEWVLGELKKKGIFSAAEVFYAEIQQDGTLHIN